MVFENALPNNPNLLHAMAASKLTLESTAVALGVEGGGHLADYLSEGATEIVLKLVGGKE